MTLNHTTIKRPTLPPMDFNAGKPTPKEALFNSALTLLFITVAAIGAWVSVVFGPQSGENLIPWDFSFVGYPKAIGLLFGWAVAIVCVIFAWDYASITRNGWKSYYRRLEDWHNLFLDAYDETGAQETVDTTTFYEVRPKLPRDVVAVALCVHQEMHLDRGSREFEWPYSTRGLNRSLYYRTGKGSRILVGSLTGTRPEEMNTIFAQLGLIREQRPGYAGSWVPATERDVIQLVYSNWGKLGKRYEPEEADAY